MTLEESFKALKAAFTNKNAEAEAHAKEVSALKEKNDTLAAEIATLTEKFEMAAAAVSERDALASKVEELLKSLAAVEKEKAEANNKIESVGKKAAQIVAAAGATPVEIIPGSTAEAANKSGKELWEEYLAMPPSAAKQTFYNKHRNKIIAHLGIK